jgi:hypothetical protein
MSYTTRADLWLERSRLDGMMLGALSYGMFTTVLVELAFVPQKADSFSFKSKPLLLSCNDLDTGVKLHVIGSSSCFTS